MLVNQHNFFSEQVGFGTFEAHFTHCKYDLVLELMLVVYGKYSKEC